MAKADVVSGAAKASAVELARSPSHLLHRALQHALDIYVEAAGAGAPTQRQFAVLAAVAENEGLTQTALVRATGIDRSTLAELVARMIVKGLLARERSAADARANTVRLTEAGRAALMDAAPRVAEADGRILALLPERDRDRFLSVLSSLSAAAEHQPEPLGVDEEAAAVPGKPEKKIKKPKGEAKAEKKARAADEEHAGKAEKTKSEKKRKKRG